MIGSLYAYNHDDGLRIELNIVLSLLFFDFEENIFFLFFLLNSKKNLCFLLDQFSLEWCFRIFLECCDFSFLWNKIF